MEVAGFFSLETAEAWVNWVIAAGIFLFFVGLAFASGLILAGILRLVAHRTKTKLDDLIIKALKAPVFAALIALGLWLALVQVPELSNYDSTIHKIFVVIFIAIGAVAVVRVTNALVTWYVSEVAIRTDTDLDDKLMPILRRVGSLVIYSIALMIILSQLNVDISPLIAGLGIGGLAVALALQATLSNFLAGTQVMSDAVIRKGHYIMLDSGQEGFVEEIGWHSTKVRHWQGNLVVLPNSKLANAIVTDYDKPDASMLFAVACGVGYDSDLEKVERVTAEVAEEVMQKYPEGAKDFTPVVRFKEFGDSNINFAVVLKAVDRAGHFTLKHEFIKTLHKRFNEEGIEIQYPVRKLYFADSHAALWASPTQLLEESSSTKPEDKS